MQEYIFNVIRDNTKKKQINTNITSIFNESGKNFQELMEKSFLQALKSKLFTSPVRYMPEEKHT